MSLWILLAVIPLFVIVFSFIKRRQERLDRLRADWAKPLAIRAGSTPSLTAIAHGCGDSPAGRSLMTARGLT